jgi:hypothetical protein
MAFQATTASSDGERFRRRGREFRRILRANDIVPLPALAASRRWVGGPLILPFLATAASGSRLNEITEVLVGPPSSMERYWG